MKRFALFILAFAILAVVVSGIARAYPTITTDLLDAYDMSTLDGSDLQDFGPNNYDLTISGATPVAGVCVGAYSFDGTNDKMTNANSPLVGDTTFTVALYVSKAALAGTAYVLRFGSDSSAIVYGFTANTYQIFVGGFLGNVAISDTDKHWVVWSSNGITVKAYLDGTEVDSDLSPNLGAASTFVVGGSLSNDFFGGVVDELYVYSEGLSPTDVSNIAPVCTNPPVVMTNSATGVFCNSVTLNGNLTDMGTSTNVTVGFLYGKQPNLIGAINVTAGIRNTTGLFNKTVSGLDGDTVYYFQAWANGTDGFDNGTILFFTTSVCPIVCIPGGDTVILWLLIFAMVFLVALGLIVPEILAVAFLFAGFLSFGLAIEVWNVVCTLMPVAAMVGIGAFLIILAIMDLLS